MVDMIFTCFLNDDAVRLKKLLDIGLPINNYYDYYGNQEKFSRKEYASNIRIKNRTLLLQALRLDAINCAKLLLDNGADLAKVDEDMNSAFIMASCLSETNVIEIVNRISTASALNINATNVYNTTALGAAVRKNNGEYVRWLLINGADYATVNGVKGCSQRLERPILFDAASARRDIFDMLLTKHDAHIDSLDCNGNGILIWLEPKLYDYEDRFKFLISRGAKITGAKRSKNVLIINMRRLGDCAHRIQMICSYDIDKETLETALLYAKKKNLSNCVEVLERHFNALP